MKENHSAYLLKVDHSILGAIVVNLWELYHQVHEVGVPLVAFIDHLNLAESQSVKPVHRHHVTIVMLLRQLKENELK